MANEISLFKKTVLTWVYQTLNSKFPKYFNNNPYRNLDGQTIKNAPNVYWADSISDRPLNATSCYLDIISDESPSFGTDSTVYQDETDGKYYRKLREPHEVTVNFSITSMKNGKLGLTALEAQNLTYNACSYLKMLLKSGSASDYFRYENGILTPILVCSQAKNVSEILDTSIFEDTRNRHTNQFSCKFSFDQIDKYEIDVAQNVFNEVKTINEKGETISFEFYVKDDN